MCRFELTGGLTPPRSFFVAQPTKHLSAKYLTLADNSHARLPLENENSELDEFAV
jgi:hypothetical protein